MSEMRTPNAPEDSRSYTTALLKITRPSKFASYRMVMLSNRTPIQKQLHIFFILKARQKSFDSIVDAVISQLDGAFALAIIDEQTPDVIWAVKAYRW